MSIEDLREEILRVIDKNILETEKGVQLIIRVDADPSENYLTIEGDELVFKTRDASDPNRCNSTLIGFLSTSLKIQSSRIDIAYGARDSYVKRVVIRDVRKEDLLKKLLRILRPL